MKYERTEFGAYKSRKTPVAYVEDVIINFGKNIELILYEHLSSAYSDASSATCSVTRNTVLQEQSYS